MQSDDVSVRYTIFGGILTQLQFIPEVASGVTGVTSQLGSIFTQTFFSAICPGEAGLVEQCIREACNTDLCCRMMT